MYKERQSHKIEQGKISQNKTIKTTGKKRTWCKGYLYTYIRHTYLYNIFLIYLKNENELSG